MKANLEIIGMGTSGACTMTTQPDLFAPTKPQRRPSVTLTPGAFADVRLDDMLADIQPAQFTYSMYGKTGPRPRQEAWFHPSMPYTFGGGAPMLPREWTPMLFYIRDRIEDITRHDFDSCFANYYTDGSKHIDWHADDERWIGPVIASVSLGARRRFQMRPKDGGPERPEWSLGNGDLLVMHAGTQAEWQHSLRKTSKPVGPRLNLTFRQTVAS